MDDDIAVRGHFKRILWHAVVTRAKDEDKRMQLQQSNMHTVFQTDEEIIEELTNQPFHKNTPIVYRYKWVQRSGILTSKWRVNKPNECRL